MKKLFEILPVKLRDQLSNVEDQVIDKLTCDSREVSTGSLFFALAGTVQDGRSYIPQALKSGASLVIAEKSDSPFEDSKVLEVEDARGVMAEIVKSFYNDPSSGLNLIGVTGTNGKTTVTTILYQLFTALGYDCGLISTVNYVCKAFNIPARHTTPDVITFNEVLNKMKEAGVEFVFAEVSSHSISQRRIEGLDFGVRVFTNLSHDHLDYHGSFAEYRDAKKTFFDLADKQNYCIYNVDDKNGGVMVQNTRGVKLGYGLYEMTDFKGRIVSNSIEGLHLNINQREFYCRLIGKFNAYNLLSAYSVAKIYETDEEKILQVLSSVTGALGRFQLLKGEAKKIFAIVDYAHTPDALQNVLETIEQIKNSNQKVVTVFGCGGDRDSAKRPKMGFIASQLSDTVVVTSDNPRSEDPFKIMEDIVEGIDDLDKVLQIENRRQAIKTAVQIAQENDIVIIAGKGHEKYQQVKGERFPFDDIEEIKKLIL